MLVSSPRAVELMLPDCPGCAAMLSVGKSTSTSLSRYTDFVPRNAGTRLVRTRESVHRAGIRKILSSTRTRSAAIARDHLPRSTRQARIFAVSAMWPRLIDMDACSTSETGMAFTPPERNEHMLICIPNWSRCIGPRIFVPVTVEMEREFEILGRGVRSASVAGQDLHPKAPAGMRQRRRANLALAHVFERAVAAPSRVIDEISRYRCREFAAKRPFAGRNPS